jgi:acyl-homoserine lactone acylase PvdQ
MGKWIRSSAAALTAVVSAAALTAASAFGAGQDLTAASASSLANEVTVTRDGAGIPHIVARNFAALGYGGLRVCAGQSVHVRQRHRHA